MVPLRSSTPLVRSQIPISFLAGRCPSCPTADEFPRLQSPEPLQARSPSKPRAKRALPLNISPGRARSARPALGPAEQSAPTHPSPSISCWPSPTRFPGLDRYPPHVPPPEPLISLHAIEKHFGPIHALAGVDFDLHPGE